MNNGVTVVSRDTFVNARPVARNLGHFDARQVANAPVERGISVQPIRASVLGSGAPARFRPPQAVINRQVVATQRPMPPRQPFEQRQAAINMRTERPGQPQPLGNQRIAAQWRARRSLCVRRRPAQAANSGMPPPRPEARPQRPMARRPRAAEPVRRTPSAIRPRRRPATGREWSLFAGLVTSPGKAGSSRAAKESQPRRGKTRINSAPGSNSASSPLHRRIGRHRYSDQQRHGRRKTDRSRRIGTSSSKPCHCQFPENGDWQFCLLSCAHDRLLGTGELRTGNWFSILCF